MNLTPYGANALLDGTALPATLWVQFHTGDPSPACTDNVAADDRRRSFTRTAAVDGECSNAALLEWLLNPTAEDLTHLSVWDASSGGNPWWVGAITGAPISTVVGQATEIPLGSLVLSLDVWT